MMGELRFFSRADGRMGVEEQDDACAMPERPHGMPMLSVLRRESAIPAIALDVVAASAVGIVAGFAALSQRPADVPFILACALAATAIVWDALAERRLKALRSEFDRLKGWQEAERRINAQCRADGQAEIANLRRQVSDLQQRLARKAAGA